MVTFPTAAWILIAVLMGLGAIGVLYPLAIMVRNNMAVIELRRDAVILKKRYDAYVKALRSEYESDIDFRSSSYEDGYDVDIVDDADAPSREMVAGVN